MTNIRIHANVCKHFKLSIMCVTYAPRNITDRIPDNRFCRRWRCVVVLAWWCPLRLLPSWWLRGRRAPLHPWPSTPSTSQLLPTSFLPESSTVDPKRCCLRTCGDSKGVHGVGKWRVWYGLSRSRSEGWLPSINSVCWYARLESRLWLSFKFLTNFSWFAYAPSSVL